MIAFRTEVNIEEAKQKISIDSKILSIGSCFTENIGNKLLNNKFDIKINPFGILYNPQSIAITINQLLNNYEFSNKDLIEQEGSWYSIFHHGRYTDENSQRLLKNINQEAEISREFIKKTDFIFITFGTSWVYELKEKKQIVSNCHKLPAKSFERFSLSVDEVVSIWTKTITELLTLNPNVQIILTVSPIRHLKDGAVENQQSKATLLLAVAELIKTFANVHYFPAYELMMDDLRDYRFYNDDMLHPSPFAVNYIWQNFKKTWIDKQATVFIGEVEKVYKSLNHKPFRKNTMTYQQFLDHQLFYLNNLQKKYPKVDFTKEIEQIKQGKSE